MSMEGVPQDGLAGLTGISCNVPKDTREVPTHDLPGETDMESASPRYEEVSKWPVAAKFERGQWFYEKQARRSNGRISSRWFPSIAFT